MRCWKLLLAAVLCMPAAAQAQTYRSVGATSGFGVLIDGGSGVGTLRQATVPVVYEPAIAGVTATVSLLNLDCTSDNFNELERDLLDASMNRIGTGPRRTGSAYTGYQGLVAAHLCDGATNPGFNQVYQGKAAAVAAMQSRIRGY